VASIEIPSYACLREAAPAEAGQGFGGLSTSGEIHRNISFEHLNTLATFYAFIHGQSPCLHAEVRFGTQA